MRKIIALCLVVGLSLTILAGCSESKSDEAIQSGTVINKFCCDNSDILIGEEATVTFTADIVSDLVLGMEDVYVTDNENNVIGYMNDAGINGDQNAGDGTYTLSYNCESDETKVIPCHVVAGEAKSSSVWLNFYRVYTNEEFEQANDIAENLNACIDPFMTEDHTVLESNVDFTMNEIMNVLKEMEGTGKICDYKAGDSCVEITTSTGFPFIYSLEVDGYDAGGAGGKIVTFQPHIGTYGVDNGVDLNEMNTASSDGSAKKIETNFPQYYFSDEANFDLDEVTISNISNLGEYSVIIWTGHGGYIDGVGSILSTGELVTDEKNLLYSDDINAHYVYVNYTAGGRNTYVITGGFFEKYIAPESLTDAFIYLAACDSAMDMLDRKNDEYSLVQSLLDKGAAAVFANSETIASLYNYAMEADIISYMCEAREDGLSYHTASEALSYAKEQNGNKDPYNSGDHDKAEVCLFAQNDVEAAEYSFQQVNEDYVGTTQNQTNNEDSDFDMTEEDQIESVTIPSIDTVKAMADQLSIWAANVYNIGTERIMLTNDQAVELAANAAFWMNMNSLQADYVSSDVGMSIYYVIPENMLDSYMMNLFGSQFQASNYTNDKSVSAFSSVVPNYYSIAEYLRKGSNGQFQLSVIPTGNYAEADVSVNSIAECMDGYAACTASVYYDCWIDNYGEKTKMDSRTVEFGMVPDETATSGWAITSIRFV